MNDYPTFTKVVLDLGEKALARDEVRKGAYYLRLAEFFLLFSDSRKLPTRQRFVDLLLDHLHIAPSAYSTIPFETGWLPSYRLTPEKPKGTLVVFGGFDSYIEEWMPAALVFRDAGYDTILFEGPGQGAALELAHLTMSPEWERPVKAVLDFFRLDAVTLMGFSLGGGLVIRAAAAEPRVRRVIAYDIMTNGIECVLRPLPPPAQKQLLDWIDTGNEGAVDKFFADAVAKSLLLDWMVKLALHNTGTLTTYAMLKHYQKYETASISSRVTQDVLLMAGAEDHYIPVHQLADQVATLTQVRSLTARLSTRAEQAQNHVQVGNMGLAFRTMIDWMSGLGPIERDIPRLGPAAPASPANTFLTGSASQAPLPGASATTSGDVSPSAASPHLYVGWSDNFHSDPVLNFQLNRWYQYGGPRWLEDVRPILSKLTSLDAWKDTFLALGERVLADRRPFHAALDLRAAEFFMTIDDPRKEPTRRRVLPLLRAGSGTPDSARRWVAFEGAQLPAWHFVADRSKGTFVVFGGYDSYIEEFFPWISKMRDDGWTVVAFEGPGQGTPLEESKTVLTPEWHRVVGALLDAFGLDDVTLLGVSLGGCLVMRAAAFEPRVRRVIAFDVLADFYATLTSLLPATVRALADATASHEGKNGFDAALREAMTKSPALDWLMKQGLHVLGGKTPSDLYDLARNFHTRDVSGHIRQDVLLMAGTEDLAAPLGQAWEQGRLLTVARSTTIRVFTREEDAQMHCQLGNTPLAVGFMETWAEERIRSPRS